MVTYVLPFLLLLLASVVGVEGFVPAPKSTPGSTRETVLSARQQQTHDGEQDDGGETGGITRRRALTATGLAVASLWLGDTFGIDSAASKWAAAAAGEASAPAAGAGRTVLITGGNSGVGLNGARILARRGGGERIILACRTKQKAEDAAARIRAESPGADLVPAECDLASLESVRKFAASLAGTVDVACYNAGLALDAAGEIERTADGFEKTVGTNHLGHFYLHHLLEPKLAAGGGGRVVITASSVHDPDSPGGKQGVPATLGSLEGFARNGAAFEMVDGRPYNGDKAYKDSKLCNVFFCRELARRYEGRNIVVNAFSPGLITSGGFFRYQNPIFTAIFDVAASRILRVAETPEYGGAALAYMTTVDSTQGEFYDSPPGTSFKYAADKNDYKGAFGKEFNLAQVSKEAKDGQKGQELWRLSEKLVGI